MFVRTWNLFHGNTQPPQRCAFLAEMVRLAVADGPDVVCLQELPVWALRRLPGWSGMTVVGAVAARPKLPPELGRRITDLDHGLFRSALTGQANALLVAPALRLQERRTLVLNPFAYRRRVARRLHLSLADRLAWAKERRVCQVVRLARGDGSTLVAANLHATGYRAHKHFAEAELLRAATFADGFARRGEPVLLAGDFNVTTRNSPVLRDLLGPEWGFEGVTPNRIDHLLTRGLDLGPPSRWPDDRRRLGGRLLSDHAPVDRRDA